MNAPTAPNARRHRNARIVATIGPASSDPQMMRALFQDGVDVFRLNFSHGTHEVHRESVAALRAVETETGRPIAILADLQGPKLRVGTFANGPVDLVEGATFRLDLDTAPGSPLRANLPHREIFAALVAGTELLLDDGKLRLRVETCGPDFADTTVLVGGPLGERKGVNVPGVVLPISALTDKDRRDLAVALECEVDWIALSFVQRPEDVAEVQAIVAGRAGVVAKLEKPAAIERLEAIVALADAVMVARGDLGVEMPHEQVPAIQKRIVRACRRAGKPVIVATQMLESMTHSPVPTRAEASDVATAVYDGADAVMLSAESAVGKHPRESVTMMHRIIAQVEADPAYRQWIDVSHTPLESDTGNVADAILCAMRHSAALLAPAAIVCYTNAGNSSLRAARERPQAPILSLTPHQATARRLALVWGVHSALADHVADAEEMATLACLIAKREGFAKSGDALIVIAGMPFGRTGSTNLMRIASA